MKFNKKMTLALGILVCASAISATAVAAAAQQEISAPAFALQERYVYGETLSTEGATVEIGGKTVAAEAILYRPDGRASTGKTFRLDGLGQYTLELYASHAGERASVRKTFLVGEDICTFTGAGSYTATGSGINVSLGEGSRLTVNRTVDVTGVTADEEIVTIAVTPQTAGQADFTKITVTLTDEKNSDCYLKMLLQASPTNPAASYGLAGGTNQALTGYEKEWDRIHKNNEWGSYMPFTFYGTDGASSEFGVRYDSETKKVYALEGREIIDLDEKKFFPNKFTGFESGKVRVSVECASYNSDAARFTVKKLRGEPITETFVADKTPPVITVQKQNAYAVTGRSFPLFPASARDDIAGEVEVKAAVYRNYGKTNRYLVDSFGGAFTPQEAGVYTIEYTAKDAFGNLAREIAEMEAVTQASAISLTLGEGAEEGTLGTPAQLRTPMASGGSGDKTMKVVARKDGKEIPIENGVFVPETAGEYEIVYTATDYIGDSATESYTFRAAAGREPLFGEAPVLPRYFIAGDSFVFEPISVRDYTSGTRTDGVSEIYLMQNNSRRKVGAGVPVTLDFDEGKLTVIYRYKETELRKTVPVVAVKEDGKLNLGKYFSGEKIEVSVNSTGTQLRGGAGGSVEFIRELLAEGLTARFDVGKGGIGALCVTLTDYADPQESIEIMLIGRGNGYAMSVNGTELCTGTGIGFTEASASNEFSLRYESGAVSCDGVTLYSLEEALPQFHGFSSGRAYLSFRFVQASDGVLTVKNVNRQPTNSVNSDRIPPRIVLRGEYGGEKRIGDEVLLSGADALDVLDSRLTFTLTVTDSDGEIVSDLDGTPLSAVDGRGTYRFRIAKYGGYKVAYTARDGTGFQDGGLNYVISVEDKSAPEITFAGELAARYKKGETIVLPKHTVTDNLDGEEELSVYRYVTLPSGKTVTLAGECTALIAEETGTYVYCVAAYDGAGNMGFEKIAFTVTD